MRGAHAYGAALRRLREPLILRYATFARARRCLFLFRAALLICCCLPRHAATRHACSYHIYAVCPLLLFIFTSYAYANTTFDIRVIAIRATPLMKSHYFTPCVCLCSKHLMLFRLIARYFAGFLPHVAAAADCFDDVTSFHAACCS